MQTLILVASVGLAGLGGFVAASSAYDAFDNNGSAVNLATRCEVQFSDERCPAKPGTFHFGSNNLLVDTFDNSDKDETRCLKRAAEYALFCGSKRPVVSLFYHGGQIVASKIAK